MPDVSVPVSPVPASSLGPSPLSATFTPRREFLKSPRPVATFYLVSFSGSSLIRLSNFPSSFVRPFKQALEPIRDFRDDPQQKLWEINLNSKPWASPRAVESELLILRIFSFLFSHNYSYVSSIDYGKESDDKLTLVFSKSSASSLSSTGQATVQVPFGLSFPTPTLLRAINIPLSSTPSILYALRTAWPKGIASEKKLADGCYEFKLKGYSILKEDTFPIDSLNHILNLLSSLDERGFSLMASLCVSGNHHRVKDLWILTGREDVTTPSSSSSRLESPPRIPPVLPTTSPQGGAGEGLPLWEQFSSHGISHDRERSMPVARQNGAFSPTHGKSASEGQAALGMPQPMPYRRPIVSADSDDSGIIPNEMPAPVNTSTQIYTGPESGSVERVIYSSPQQTGLVAAAAAHGHDSPRHSDPASPNVETVDSPVTDEPRPAVPEHAESVQVQSSSEFIPPVPLPMIWQKDQAINGEETQADDTTTPTPLTFPLAHVAPAEAAKQPSAPVRSDTAASTPNVPGGWTNTPAQELEKKLEQPSSPTTVEEHSQAVIAHKADHVEGSPDSRKSQFGVTGVVAEPVSTPGTVTEEPKVVEKPVVDGPAESAKIKEAGAPVATATEGHANGHSPAQAGVDKQGSLFKRMFRHGRRNSKFGSATNEQ